jgi:hypothetical protein
MTCLTQVNCRKHRQTYRAKDADRLQPKRYAVRPLAFSMQAHGHYDCRCSGQGLNPSSLFERNMVNPTSLLSGGRPTVRKVDGMRGNGSLDKANDVL